MSSVIPQVQGNYIKHCLLIEIYVNENVYYLSNAYNPITYNGNVYTQLGHFIGMSEIQDDLRATNNQISMTLTGIPPDPGEINYMSIALNSNLKGSRVKIYRAFFSPDSGYYDPAAVYLRFNGYVNNFSLSENWDNESKTTSNNISIQCSSIHAILEKSYSGRRTNENDQQFWFPGDSGMYKIKSLADSSFDFGKPYASATNNVVYTAPFEGYA